MPRLKVVSVLPKRVSAKIMTSAGEMSSCNGYVENIRTGTREQARILLSVSIESILMGATGGQPNRVMKLGEMMVT